MSGYVIDSMKWIGLHQVYFIIPLLDFDIIQFYSTDNFILCTSNLVILYLDD